MSAARRGAPPGGDEARVVRGWGPPWLRVVLIALAVVYLLAVWLRGVGGNSFNNVIPQPFRYFTQIARLFVGAANVTIDYRLEGWLCAEGRFVEVDYRPHFPIHRDNKESRFHRVAHFHRQDREVMVVLEDFMVERHNARVAAGLATEDHPPGLGPIGGIRLLHLRRPFPAPGELVEPYDEPLIETFPETMRRQWYWTRASMRDANCAALAGE